METLLSHTVIFPLEMGAGPAISTLHILEFVRVSPHLVLLGILPLGFVCDPSPFFKLIFFYKGSFTILFIRSQVLIPTFIVTGKL